MPLSTDQQSPYRGKRTFDLVLLALVAPLAVPILGLLACVTRLKMGTPILFRQARAGRDGRVFHLVKFRTMRDEMDASGRPLPDADRITSFGRWMRSTSLDELPELVNILRGEMSFVGPRPLHTRYVPLYSKNQRRRLKVTPGLTGLAQVSGRNAIGWSERFELDVMYVDRASLKLDFSILIKTLFIVAFRRGIDSGQGETMPEFMGSRPDASP